MERSFLPSIADFIHRPRIDALIAKGLEYSLLLIIAGPGYGKTLSTAHFLKTADVRLMWVHISNHRTKAADLWEDLVLAAERELPAYAQELDALGFPDSAGKFEQFRRITAETAKDGKRLVLVIDNYERLIDENVIRVIDNLIDSDLPHFTMVILCNIIIPFAEALPAAGQYRITDKTLAFTIDEARMMYAHYGVSPTPKVVERACVASGGWPLGLRLICESNPEHPEEYSSRTSVQMAADLFEQHYFRCYPPDVQTQLTLFSLLPQFSLGMLQCKMGTSHEQFNQLLMQHPFISYDYTTGLFLYQAMYHDFLQQKQTLISRELRNGMFAAAGSWFVAHDMLSDAMDCFWEAADYDAFLDTIKRLPKVRKPTSLTSRVLKRLEQIPRSYADGNPMVDFSIAFMYLNAADAIRARDLFLAVEAQLKTVPESEENRLLLGDIYATLADISTFLNEDTGLEWMKKACALIPNGSRTHSPELLALGNSNVFFLPSNQPGQLEHMVDYFMDYAQYADRVKNGSGHGYEYLFAGEAAYYREEMDKAATMLNSAMLKAQRTAQHDIICNALWGLGCIELYYANYKNALALLNEIETYVNDNNLVALYELRDCAAAYFYMRLGDLEKVPAWFGQVLSGPDEMPIALGRNRLISAAYLLQRGDHAQAYAVMLQLESLLRNKGKWSERFFLYVRMAQYHLLVGDDDALEAVFHKAYSMVYPCDMKIALSAYGKEMMSMLDHLRRLNTGQYDAAWLDAVYKDAVSYAKRAQMMRKAYSGEIYGHPSSSLKLTVRENETLRYLAQGLTQQEIAKLMGISDNAVKKHVSKIYHKLGAVNRADAIHIASINGLVDVLHQ